MRLHEGKHRQLSGNFHHVRQLADALLQRDDIKLRILVDKVTQPEFLKFAPPESLFPCEISGDSIAEVERATAHAVRAIGPDIYHRPTGQLPFRLLNCKTVAGVADLNFRVLPTPCAKRIYKELSYRWTFFIADRVSCVSHFTAGEVGRLFHVPKSKLRVVQHGANVLSSPDYQLASGIHQPFWIVFVHQAHKNAEVCIRALDRVRVALPRATLALIGEGPHVDSALRPMVLKLGLAESVCFLGRVDAGTLSGLYRSAAGLLFMSRYEGFGLPVLEAMSLGCPVISSNVCSLPEVAGDAGIQLCPDDEVGLAMTMIRLEENRAEKELLIRRGFSRASEFTWARAVAETVEIYRELAL